MLALASACRTSSDEERIGQRLETNNEILQKQANLLKDRLELNLIRSKSHQDIRRLKRTAEQSVAFLGESIDQDQDRETFESRLMSERDRINDSLSRFSKLQLFIDLTSLKSNDALLLEAWKQNNLLLYEVQLWETCLQLYEIQSTDASAYLRPVVMTRSGQKLVEGGNAIFDIAFKSLKTSTTEIRIDRVLLNGKPIDKKGIEVDKHTQRFIVHQLKAGKYTIVGTIMTTNDLGERVEHPFMEEFQIP